MYSVLAFCLRFVLQTAPPARWLAHTGRPLQQAFSFMVVVLFYDGRSAVCWVWAAQQERGLCGTLCQRGAMLCKSTGTVHMVTRLLPVVSHLASVARSACWLSACVCLVNCAPCTMTCSHKTNYTASWRTPGRTSHCRTTEYGMPPAFHSLLLICCPVYHPTL
jgi:hypothetical protein